MTEKFVLKILTNDKLPSDFRNAFTLLNMKSLSIEEMKYKEHKNKEHNLYYYKLYERLLEVISENIQQKREEYFTNRMKVFVATMLCTFLIGVADVSVTNNNSTTSNEVNRDQIVSNKIDLYIGLSGVVGLLNIIAGVVGYQTLPGHRELKEDFKQTEDKYITKSRILH
jgi:hypothetical protein